MYLRTVLTIIVLSTVILPVHRKMVVELVLVVVVVVVVVVVGLYKNHLEELEAGRSRPKGKSPTTGVIEKNKVNQENKVEEKILKAKVRIAVIVVIEILSRKIMEEEQRSKIKGAEESPAPVLEAPWINVWKRVLESLVPEYLVPVSNLVTKDAHKTN